jgi:hypothetical protein
MSNREYLAEIRAATGFTIPPEYVKLEEADLTLSICSDRGKEERIL